MDTIRTIDKLLANAKILLVLQALLTFANTTRGKDVDKLCDELMSVITIHSGVYDERR